MALAQDVHPEESTHKEHEFAAGTIAKFLSSKNSTGQMNIADIGCSDGRSTATVMKTLPSAKITGVEIDLPSVERARKNTLGENVRFIEGDARATGLQKESLDAILSCQLIEHVSREDQVKVMSEYRRILKAGGVLVLSTPDRTVLERQGTAGLQPNHIAELTREELEELVQNGGFSIIGVYGQGFLKIGGNSKTRTLLNILKKLDVLKLRKYILGRRIIDTIDTKTQPIDLNFDIRELQKGAHALNIIVVAEKWQ